MRAKFLPKVLLALGFVLLFLIIQYQSQLKDFWSFIIEKVSIYSDNFFFPVGAAPERKRPVSLIERETELALYIGEPFRSFKASDWEDFWNIIYGGFQKEEPGRKGMPKKMRQLTEEEIKFELASRYPQPFSSFLERHWRIFFGIIFKK